MTLRRWIAVWIVVGVLLRIGAAVGLDPVAPYAGTGGDSGWYLANGYALTAGRLPCPDALHFPAFTLRVRALAHDGAIPYTCTLTDTARLPTPPLYLILVGWAQQIAGFQSAAALMLIRVGQIAAGGLLIALLAIIAHRIAGDHAVRDRAAVITAAFTALHPGLIVEAGQIVSEPVYLLLTAAAFAAFLTGLERRSNPLMLFALAGVCFGLAALTRAAIVAFPLALLVYGVIVRRTLWRSLLIGGIAYALTLGSWTAYNLLRYDRLVIGGEGFAAFLYVGATGWDTAEAIDQRLAEQTGTIAGETGQGAIAAAAVETIRADLGGYAQRRAAELIGAAIQPHGTTYYAGPSLRELAAGWWAGERSLGGLIALTGAEGFWPKLLLYLAHFGAIALAAIGVARLLVQRVAWRGTLVLLGWVGYVLAVHLALLALPRYLFPALIALLPLAGAAFSGHSRPGNIA